jgi:hypothetical protein
MGKGSPLSRIAAVTDRVFGVLACEGERMGKGAAEGEEK